MEDERKTKKQLISELVEMRQLVAALNGTETECRQARAALQESEARFRNLLDYVPGVSIQEYTADGIVRYWNKASEEVYGYTAEEAIGRNLGDLIIPPEVKPQFKQALELGAKCTKSGEFMPPGELMLLHKNGSLVPVYSIHTVVCLDGRPPLMFCIDVDLSERKRTEEALRESEARFWDLYQNAPNAYFSTGVDGLIRRCNKRAGELLGCPAEELVGKPVFELYADTPQGKDEASKVFQRFLAGERIIDEELQMQKADGTPVWISLTVNAIRDAEGQIVESRSMVVDITERKRAEDALRQANLIVENSPAVLFRWKAAEGWPVELVSENVTQFGYTPEELLSGEVPYASLVHPDDLERVAYEVQEYSASGVERFQQEYRIITKDGQVRCLDDQTVIERDAHGQITHYQGIVLDITQRKQAEKELQKYRDHLEELVKKRTSELTAANKQLKQALSEIQDLKDRLEAENINLREEIKLEHNFEEIIGQSDTLKYVLYKVEEVAPTDSTILILGETGTGKELVARAIHNNSSRKSRPLVKVDCTALPANLIESELFGHERGAFSGAVQQRKGRFEIANGSTLFLDEIGELSMELQSKLLRVLECGEFERLGSSKTIYTDVRIIAATNRNLKEEVEKGRFRQDLWYRLNVFSIRVPPLKKRPEDIPLLIEWFVAKFTRKMGKTIKTIPKKTMKALQEYHWPGNVRELSNVIESAMISSHDTTLRIPDMLETLKHDSKDKIEIVSMTEMEKDHIVQAIETCHWRIEGKNGAAELLGLNPGTLRGRMRKYGIKRP